MNQRLTYFDIAKGISIICVILGHLGIDKINRVVFVFHMPLFFFISGYFLSLKQDYITYVKKKLQTLLVPYYFTCFLICILSIPVSFVLKKPVANFFLNWVGGTIYAAGDGRVHGLFGKFPMFIGALWFLWALFLSLIIVRRILDSVPEKYRLFSIAAISYVGYATSRTIWLPLDIQAGMNAALFVYIGYLFNQEQFLNCKARPDVIIICACITAWCIKYFKGFWMVVNFYGNGLMDVVGAISSIYLLLLLSKKISNLPKLNSILEWYGRNSIIILAFHIIELDLIPLGSYLPFLLSLGLSKKAAFVVIILVKIIWASLGVVMVQHIPLLRKIYLANRTK